MITSFAEFLEQLQAKEAELLAAEAVQHAPTIGDMYEGLTRELVGRAIPKELNLRLIDGFILGVDGKHSHQTDAMLVKGNRGRQLPKTDTWEWPIADVLAVFEVKKNLYGNELTDSIKKMQTISLQQKELLSENRQVHLGPSNSAFARLMGRSPESGELDDLASATGELLRTIAHEQLAPVRVVFGYDGYVDEIGLRNGFLDALEKVPDGLAGPAVLPNLIVCRTNALLKLNGHPYIVPELDDGQWHIFGSTREAPMVLLLELLWTRLSNEFQARFPVDDTLKMEAIAPLLCGKPIVDRDQRGWMFYAKTLTRKQLAEIETQHWTPFEVSLEENVVFAMAMNHGGLALDDEDLLDAADQYGLNLSEFADRLVAARLFSWKSTGLAHPISDTIHQAISPDGRFWLSANNDLLRLWITENFD
jgi:hypothetical protein